MLGELWRSNYMLDIYDVFCCIPNLTWVECDAFFLAEAYVIFESLAAHWAPPTWLKSFVCAYTGNHKWTPWARKAYKIGEKFAFSATP